MLRSSPKTDSVQDFIEFCLAWLEERDYSLTIDADLSAWVAAMTEGGSPFVNPAFDPRHSRLGPENSFWLDIRSGSQTIATSTARLFLTDDYIGLKRSMRLWYAEPPQDAAELRIITDAPIPAIRGRVGHEGGLWVHPSHRKRGLSVILPHLNRALCLREWMIDWQTGITMKGIGESGLAEKAYGFPHVVRCFEGHLPVTNRVERLYMTYMSAAELVTGLDLNTVANLLPDGHRKAANALMLV